MAEIVQLELNSIIEDKDMINIIVEAPGFDTKDA